MQLNSPKLFIEINKFKIVFLVGDNEEENRFKVVYSKVISHEGISQKYAVNFEMIYKILKENIFLVEQKLNFTFKDAVIIIDSFEFSLINFSGFKKLNGSQLTKQNITYIINHLRSKIDELEKEKKVIHIFNSAYLLDKKETENLPIGLFGNFYSHELSFFLINRNDYKNLENIFQKCNLKINKIISKNFTEGAYLINKNLGLKNFFLVEINEYDSKIILFENSSLKFIQDFNFGTNLILRDISKITKLNEKNLKNIFANLDFSKVNQNKDEVIEKEFYDKINYRKIKKKLIIDIAEARIQEFAEIMLFKNINLGNILKKKNPIFLTIEETQNFECFKKNYMTSFSKKNYFDLKLITHPDFEKKYMDINTLVQFGWKSEAVPVVQEKKSIISKLFDLVFN